MYELNITDDFVSEKNIIQNTDAEKKSFFISIKFLFSSIPSGVLILSCIGLSYGQCLDLY